MTCTAHGNPWVMGDRGDYCAVYTCRDGCATVLHIEPLRYGVTCDPAHPPRSHHHHRTTNETHRR